MDVLTQSTEHIYIVAPKGDICDEIVFAKGYFIGCPILVNAVGIDQEVAQVCCSSSLWFDDWDEYASSHRIKSPSTIYMSLGDREEKTKNKTMSKLGDRTRRQAEILKNDPNVEKLFFEWNKGGHFDEPLKRVAKGIAGIMG